MNTPKEEAKRILELFGDKENALNCVNEIITSSTIQMNKYGVGYDNTLYYQEVKQEIKKL